jgi:hypothetical protein
MVMKKMNNCLLDLVSISTSKVRYSTTTRITDINPRHLICLQNSDSSSPLSSSSSYLAVLRTCRLFRRCRSCFIPEGPRRTCRCPLLAHCCRTCLLNSDLLSPRLGVALPEDEFDMIGCGADRGVFCGGRERRREGPGVECSRLICGGGVGEICSDGVAFEGASSGGSGRFVMHF